MAERFHSVALNMIS